MIRWAVPLLALAACAAPPDQADWRAHEASLYAEGRLRSDRAPADVPFTNRDLVRNFGRIAFGVEPQINGGDVGPGILRRWQRPVRWQAFITGGTRFDANAEIVKTFERIALATGHDIAPATDSASANLDILVLGPEDFPWALDWAGGQRNGQAELINAFRTNGLPCMGQFYYTVRANGDVPAGSLTYAVVLVRKGFTPAFRLSCFEEELAQVMGLANDDARVRPSIFNDDEEFALLTTHDAALLGLLYDPVLSPGMTEDEALPLVERILSAQSRVAK